MASSQPDSSPNSGNKAKGGQKNVDGRVDGAAWNSDKSKAAFKDKAVDCMPNEGAPELSKKGVVAEVIE